MKKYITTIKLAGSEGNCYLVKTSNGYILIITGERSTHRNLNEELTQLGINSDNLNLIIFTHCNLSVCNKYAGLKEKYHVKTAIHVISKSVNLDNKTWFQEKIESLIKKVFHLTGTKLFSPDIIIDEGFNLSEYGLNARVIYMPGFSESSIGILTENGELFCDDIFVHQIPQVTDEKKNLRIVKNLKNLFVDIIYPGYGEPFTINT